MAVVLMGVIVVRVIVRVMFVGHASDAIESRSLSQAPAPHD
jgi:hypothetical protein